MELKYDRKDYKLDQIDPHWADRQMVEFIGNGKKVLEIGCATGYIGKFLKEKRNCVLWAVELEQHAAEMARPFYENIFVGDVQSDNFFKGIHEKFDVILCSNVLEHLTDPLGTILRLKHSLSKKGFFIIALPNVAHWSVRLNLLLGRFDYTKTGILDDSHLKFFTLKTARKFLQDSGLKIDNWGFDWDNGIPKFNGLLNRIPIFGQKFLKFFYSISPEFFGYQFIFKASVVDEFQK
ncbi:MAG: hypothetical protein A3I11_03455 [Elusimicrobia bacterium RIFCSPLOWO2_02_FULL_39_32]|nr:MAG: hypothetical protein A2034_04415 [Elusimicrobia bacterium GWA2_38_7]OGR79437.1 MAG: hypothetical protein A3B80_02025 [Elusimicrobia bacterium RIFCSPHIGHO2_02_FULL_39_36]OGR92764.1 MAG: hypothetical protein A3I11_03455 [Elusimicrobia bacterium RIFCSPLOWO2_02_FULL_39_32]OGR99549.1 MAG: hypothetical protein A3G85_00810 [Elusimicrobia bacterium RIFCSPLOWO2_12_FULL_39_28]